MITPLSEGIVNKSDGPKHPTHVAGPGDKDWAEIPGLGVIWHATSEEPRQSETRADRWAMFTRWGMRYKARDRPGRRLPKYTNKLKIKLIIQLSEKIALTVRRELLSLLSCTHDHEFVSHLIY